MKLKGKKTAGGRHKDVIVFPRPEDPIVFWLQALDEEWDIFNERCPSPSPPKLTKAGGEEELDFQDEGYQDQSRNWGLQKMDFMVVFSLNVPENELEWERVDLNKPSSWKNWRAEVKEFGLSRVEVNKLFSKAVEVNSLSEDLLEQARADFLRGLQTS